MVVPDTINDTTIENVGEDISSIVIATENPEWREQITLYKEQKDRKTMAIRSRKKTHQGAPKKKYQIILMTI